MPMNNAVHDNYMRTIYISVAADYACDSLSDMCRLVDRSTDLDPNVLKNHPPCILLTTSYGIIYTTYSSRQNKEALGLKYNREEHAYIPSLILYTPLIMSI